MIINMADSFLAWDVDDLENTIPNCSNVYHIPQFIRQPIEHAHVFELGLASGRREGSTSARQCFGSVSFRFIPALNVKLAEELD